MVRHLTLFEIEEHNGQELRPEARAAADEHLAVCPLCQKRAVSDARLDGLLKGLPRDNAPRDLAVRITAAVELRVAEEKVRRDRLPLMIAATCFSAVATLWFGFQMLVSFQENGALDFVSLITSRPDVFSAYSSDAFLALLESLPIPEIMLTVFALVTVVVLALQLQETAAPSAGYYRRGHS